MKKAVIMSAIVIYFLIGSAAIFAHPQPFDIPSPRGFGNSHGFRPPEPGLPEFRSGMVCMCGYEQLGLLYNQEKGGYCYNGKLVGLFVDKHGRGITFLNRNGEVHIKAVRDNGLKLTGFAELGDSEYNEIVSEIDRFRGRIEERRNELEQQRRRMNEMYLPRWR